MLRRSTIAITLLFTAVSLLPAGVFGTPTAQQGEFTVSAAGTAAGSILHEIPLKMTQIPGGQLSETTGFVINPESVVQVKQGENIMVTTSENLKVNNVKAKNVQGQQVDLIPLPNNIWSLQNLVPGVYLLDVIVDMSSSGILGIYETVLVILQPDQTPLPPTTVINQVRILIETEFIFEDGSRPDDNQTDLNGDNQTDLNGDNQTDLNGDNQTDLNGDNQTDQILCPDVISYGQGPCDEYYIPPGEDGQCPEGHRFIDERTGCVPESEFGPPPSPPSPPTPCPLNAQDNEVCPPTDGPTPIPGPPPPDCPEAGPEVCDEQPPPPDEDPDSNGDAAGDDRTNGNGNDNGNGEDGSNGDGNNGGDSNGGNGGTFDGGGSFFD